MSVFNRFPKTDYNEINLDWILNTLGTLSNAFSETLERVTEYIEENMSSIVLSKFYRASDKTVIFSDTYQNTGTAAGEVENIQIGDNLYSIPINDLAVAYNTDDGIVILSDDTTQAGTAAGELNGIQIDGDIYTIPQDDTHYRKPLQNSTCLLLGNSWARGSGGVVGQGWPYYFQAVTGCNAKIIQQAGGDFCDGGNSNADYAGYTYYDVLLQLATELDADTRAAYDYIIVGGGLNDQTYSASVIVAAVKQFCAKARELFPNAEIWIVPLVPSTSVTVTLFNWMDAWTQGAQQAGVATCVHTFPWVYNEGVNYNDTHLTDDGYQIIGKYMAALVTGWDGVKNIKCRASWTANDDLSYTNTRYWRTGDMSFINLRFSADGANLASGTVVGTIDTRLAPKNPIAIPALRWTSSVGSRNTDFVIIQADGQLIYRPIGNNPTSGVTYTVYINSSWAIG